MIHAARGVFHIVSFNRMRVGAPGDPQCAERGPCGFKHEKGPVIFMETPALPDPPEPETAPVRG